MKAIGNYSAVASNSWRDAYALNDSGMIMFTPNIDKDDQRLYWMNQIIDL